MLPLTDAQMIQAMGNENQPNRQSCVAAQVDQVGLAKGFLEKNPGSCVWSGRSVAKRLRKESITQHRHGSVDCLSSFLGTKNWSPVKVAQLLRLGNSKSLSPKVLDKLTSTPDGGKGIAKESGIELLKLESREAQEEVADIAEKHGLSKRDVRAIVQRAQWGERDCQTVGGNSHGQWTSHPI